MSAQFTVSDSLEDADGGSGWDCEDYGPFASEAAAEDFAKRLASEGYSGHDGEHRVINVLQNGCNYGGSPRHALYCRRSDEDGEDTVHTLGPSDAEKESLLIADDDDLD